MIGLKLTVLGSGSEGTLDPDYRGEKRTSPALLIQAEGFSLLFDAGRDIHDQLQRKDGPHIEPDFVFITHAHPDHIAGLNDLFLTGSVKLLKESASIDEIQVTAIPVEHSRLAPAVGYLIEIGKRKILYFPDFLSIKDKSDLELLKDADLAFLDGSSLKHDIARGEDRNIGHASMLSSLQLAKQAGFKAVVFTHIGKAGSSHFQLQRDLDKLVEITQFSSLVILAFDGLSLSLNDSLKVLNTFGESLAPGVTRTPALLLVKPHAELIVSGLKSLIVETVQFTSHVKIPIYLFQDKLCYAKIYLGEPKEITWEEFWKLKDKHRITEAEAESWWGLLSPEKDKAGSQWRNEPKQLYASDVMVIEPYLPPIEIDYPQGVQNWILDYTWKSTPPREIQYAEPGQQSQSLGKVFPIPEFKLTSNEETKQARDDLRLLASWFVNLRAGKKGTTAGKEITEPDLIQSGVNILKSLIKAEAIILHPTEWKETIKDFLDQVLAKLRAEGISVPIEESEPYSYDPSDLESMSDEELYSLLEDLHLVFTSEDVNRETILNTYLFVKQELTRRDRQIPAFNDELEAEALRLSGLTPTEAIPPTPPHPTAERWYEVSLVPFVVTFQAVNLIGSIVYGKEAPEDIDWLIKSYARLETLESQIVAAIPELKHHFVYEPKGSNWIHIPVGDFIAQPVNINQRTTEGLRIEILAARLGSFPIQNYIFLSQDKKSLRVASDIMDSGVLLKLERIYQKRVEVKFSLVPSEGEEVLARLVFIPYPEFIPVEVSEPEMAKLYQAKPAEQTIAEIKAEKFSLAPREIKLGEWFPPLKVGAFGYASKEAFDKDDAWKYWVEPMLGSGKKILAQEKFDC